MNQSSDNSSMDIQSSSPPSNTTIKSKVATSIYILCNTMTYNFHKSNSSVLSKNTMREITPTEHRIGSAAFSTAQSSSKSFLGNSIFCCGPCFESWGHNGQDYTRTPSINGDNNNTTSTSTILQGDAFDIIVVESADGRLFQNSDFLVSFTGEEKFRYHKIVLEIDNHKDLGNANSDTNHNDDCGTSKAWFPIVPKKSKKIFDAGKNEESDRYDEENDDSFDEKRFWGCCHPTAGSARPSILSYLNDTFFDDNEDNSNNDTLKSAEEATTLRLKPFLKPGRNPVRYLLLNEHRVIGVAHANIFLWHHKDSVVVSDIDGTITKSNARGVIDTIATERYRHCHENICNLLSQLVSKPQTQIVYITSRPLSLATSTRRFLQNVRQGQARLPEGPLLGFGGKISQVLFMELVLRTTHHFKSETLWKQIVQPFRKANANNDHVPVFVAGFGDRMMDIQAYHAIGIDHRTIFKIDGRSQIVTFDKFEPINHGILPENNTNAMTIIEVSSMNATSDGILKFFPPRWYEVRIGSVFYGYSDPKLLARLT